MNDIQASSILTIVIPALNEEEAIGGTIERCLAARQSIKDRAGLSHIEIIVVSDGSTDRTQAIAESFSEVRVIVFKENRGYGAAIQEGWRVGSGNLLGFLDADGTCDPLFFGQLCNEAIKNSADVVLGSRLGPDSKMPRIRRLGNRIYAFLLGLACGREITDTASGMRVVRREALKWLYPLPNGLHFTPAMSARALLNDLRVVEIPMRYEERIGRSKLSVVRDGVRFLQAIFTGVVCYRPERLFFAQFLICVACLFLLAAYPIEHYLQHRALEEWMIYRLAVCGWLASLGLGCLLATALTHSMASLGPRRSHVAGFMPFLVAALMSSAMLMFTAAAFMVFALISLWPGIVEFVTTGHINLHWSRLMAGVFGVSSACQCIVFALLLKVVSIWKQQLGLLEDSSPPAGDRGSVSPIHREIGSQPILAKT